MSTRLDMVPGDFRFVLQQLQDLVVSLDFTSRFVSSKFTNLAAAQDVIGTTKPTVLVLDTALVTSGPAIITPNILVTSIGGKFQKTGTGTLDFQGLGIVQLEALMALFTGFAAGDIEWSGDLYPHEISTEWWDTGNVSLSARYARADAALIGKAAKILAYPRTIDASVKVSEQHHLYFNEGDYANNLSTFGTTYTPAFLMASHSRMSGPGGGAAVLNESPNDGNGYMVAAWHHFSHVMGGAFLVNTSQTDMFVEDLWFKGNPAQEEISGGNSLINFGNAHNSAIRRNTFERTHAYTTLLGLSGNGAAYAYNSEICFNHYIGCGTQAAALISGKNLRVNWNTFDQHDSSNTSTYGLIDVEPNAENDVMEDVEISHNVMDFRDVADASKFGNAIAVQATNCPSIKNIRITHNRIYASHIIPESAIFFLTTGITVYGALEVYLENNQVRGAFQRAYNIEACRHVKAFFNHAMMSSTVSGDTAAMTLFGCADSKVAYNEFGETDSDQAAGILEDELEHTVSITGTTVSNVFTEGLFRRFHDLFKGLPVTINNSDHVIASWTHIHEMQLSVSIGTLIPKTFVDANVNTTTNAIAITAHGHITGSRVWLSSTGTPPAATPALTVGRSYFAIRVDNDNLKLANTFDLAIAGTAIDITAASGGGTHKLTPTMMLKSTNNKYWRNDTGEDGTILDPKGTSRIEPIAIEEMQGITGDITMAQGTNTATINDRVIGVKKLPLFPIPCLLGAKTPSVHDPVTWQNMVGLSITGADNRQTKTSGSSTWDTAGAYSVQSLSGDGKLIVVATEAGDKAFGFSTTDPDINFASIDYCLVLDSGLGCTVYANNTFIAAGGAWVANTTEFSFERIGTDLFVKKGATLLHTFTGVTGTLHIDTSIYTPGGTIGNVTLTDESFGDVESLAPDIVNEMLGAQRYTETLTPASVAANSTEEEEFTISGLTEDDIVILNGPAQTSGISIANVRVSDVDTLAISFANNTTGALTPTSGDYIIHAFRYEVLL